MVKALELITSNAIKQFRLFVECINFNFDTQNVLTVGRFWPSSKDVQFYGSIFSLEMVGHEEVSDCYQSWELNLKKVGLFAHR